MMIKQQVITADAKD